MSKGWSVLLLVTSTAWTLACAGLFGGKEGAEDEQPGLFEDKDEDGDGYLWDEDCNDANATIHPGAQEVCDPGDVDEDCDGLSDVADDSTSGTITAWHDADGDGFGNADEPVPVCEAGGGYVTDASDCDDTSAAIHPGATEVCDDLDNDCDGDEDDNDEDVDDSTRIDVWEDADNDGFGRDDAPGRACSIGSNFAAVPGDCDDADDDTNPGADEVCGGGDEDCDGTVDENEAVDALPWYDDADGDGFGDPDDVAVACDAPARHVSDRTDCDDGDRRNHPDADEVCDEVDNDCDGATDEDDAVDASTWHADIDGDGHGDPGSTRVACDPPTSYVADATDCDDDDASVYPSATEVCDGADTDEDCDGLADDADTSASSSGKRTFYADSDGDGYGRSTGTLRCDGGSGWESTNTDCDDTDAAISPAGSEVCDSADADEDCDGRADDSDTSVSSASKSTWWPDADGDGYGVPGATRSQCDAPSGHTSNDDDCDDGDAAVSPGDDEACDDADVDEDCDGLADDADPDMPDASKLGWSADADGDGWGSGTVAVYSCATPSGYAAIGDCDDADEHVHPDAADACTDDVDADCDGSTGCAITTADATIYTGVSSSAAHGAQVAILGDVDGDGIDDIASGAYNYADTTGEVIVLDAGAGAGSMTARSLFRAYGDSSYARLGSTMATVPDVDGDGEDDLAVGAYLSEPNGAVYLFAASTALGSTGTATSVARTVVEGSYAGAELGYERIVGLDWDGDGDGELLAFGEGTWGYYATPFNAYVLDLESPGVTTEVEDALFTITDDSDDFLFQYACAGDVTGDGRDDIFAVSWGGNLHLYESAGTGGSIDARSVDASWSGTGSDNFGQACATGDYDGDGALDLVVGAPFGGSGGAVGSAYVFTDGTAGGGAGRATLRIAGVTSYTYFGISTTFLSDLDGDGRDELAVGTGVFGGTVGQAFVFAGGTAGTVSTTDAHLTLAGRSVNDSFGRSLAAGDLDGDGLDDLVVGAQNDDGGTTNAGSVFVYFGADLFEP